MKKLILIPFAVTLLATISANAADVTIAPPAGGGFAVKSNDASSVRFKVNEAGQIYIPTLPATMAGKLLCWDQVTGLLQICVETVGRDFTPPTIEIISLVADGVYTDVTATFNDNVELATAWVPDNYSGQGGVNYFPPGTKSAQIKFSVGGLQQFSQFIIVTDTSGNTTKFTLTAP